MNIKKITNDILSALNIPSTQANFRYEFVHQTQTNLANTFQPKFTIGNNQSFEIMVSESADDSIHIEILLTSLTEHFANEANLHQLNIKLRAVKIYVNTYNKWFSLPEPESVEFSNSVLTFKFKYRTDFPLSVPYIRQYENTVNEKQIKVYFLDGGFNFEIFFGNNSHPIKLQYLNADSSLAKEIKAYKDESIQLKFAGESSNFEAKAKFDLNPIIENNPSL